MMIRGRYRCRIHPHLRCEGEALVNGANDSMARLYDHPICRHVDVTGDRQMKVH